MIRRIIVAAPLLMVLMTTTVYTVADESLSTARELYASAAYEDALAMLNRLRATDVPMSDRRGIEQYRAFCLLALGRTADAERAIEAVVSAEPSYQPSDAEVSPRLRTAFSDVRKRMLPGIIQDQYTRAKAAFDQKNYAVATSGFKEMLATLADPAVGPLANQPPLSDLKTLASGFYELSAAAVPPAPKPAPAPPPVLAVAPPRTPPPAANKIYGAQDADVQPPMAIKQALPEYDRRLGAPQGAAMLELVIDEAGNVQLAIMRGTVNAKYDAQALEAARTWRYKPATRNGVPVKYSKAIRVEVKL
jgi:protein TonB